jgi:hypothetical protein
MVKVWRTAVDVFLGQWEDKDLLVGVILTGSHAMDTATEDSDIDIFLILTEDTKWKVRGNKIVNGWLIEYFAIPAYQFQPQLESDLKRGKRTIARMLANGSILLDQNGEIARLQAAAEEALLNSVLPEIDSAATEIGNMAYGIPWMDLVATSKRTYSSSIIRTRRPSPPF